MKRPGRTTETYEGSDLLEGNRRLREAVSRGGKYQNWTLEK